MILGTCDAGEGERDRERAGDGGRETCGVETV
jgi:hypothetical protein